MSLLEGSDVIKMSSGVTSEAGEKKTGPKETETSHGNHRKVS